MKSECGKIKTYRPFIKLTLIIIHIFFDLSREERKILELKNKLKTLLLSIICGIFLITAVFFGVVAVIYTVGGGTPNVFGTIVYLVKTDAFDLTEGTALLAEQVPYSEIQPGNIVIFSLENNRPALAEIQTGERFDGVYSFTALTENGDLISLSQSQIAAKGMSYSKFWGTLITFAVSPLGVLLIAVVPCMIIIIMELAKFVRRTLPEPEIETVKKQLEVPTYAPDSRRKAAVSAYEKNSSLDDSIGLYDAQVRRNPNIERTDVLEIPAQETPLFLGPKRKQMAIPKQHIQEAGMPLSQKKLNEAIAAAKAERGIDPRTAAAERRNEATLTQSDMEETIRSIQRSRSAAIAAEKEREVVPQPKEQPVPSRTDFVPQFTPSKRAAVPTSTAAVQAPTAIAELPEEQVRRYTPRKVQAPPPVHATSSIPRLDALLSDDNDGDSYNIDDILSELGKEK